MNIPILVEPVNGKFQATTGGPLDLSAEGASAAEAVAALRAKISRRLSGGAVLIEERFPDQTSSVPQTSLADHPWFDKYSAAIEENRNRRDAEERAALENA
jgi:hypothetical protein